MFYIDEGLVTRQGLLKQLIQYIINVQWWWFNRIIDHLKKEKQTIA